MDFYAEKSRNLPRFIYRNLRDQLTRAGDDPAARAAVIGAFVAALANLKPRGDWLKLKWTLPPALAAALTEPETQAIAAALAARQGRRNDRFLEVFPHCRDEFSVNLPFLEAAFGAQRVPLFDRQTRMFTIGSCFARNIADWLGKQGYDVTPFQQAEDLNSPFSNAKMLALCAAPEDARRAYVAHWVTALYPPTMADRHEELMQTELVRLDGLAASVLRAEVIIVTAGNVLDFFLAGPVVADEPGPAVAPKFFAISISEDVERQAYVSQRMRESGAVFRLGSHADALAALASQYASLRRLNPAAQLLYTLSPVPIDSAIGLQGAAQRGAVELDCISKSTLRVALAEFLQAQAGDARLHYFPSFEIVRWIAPLADVPVFGHEDAASRHVSQDVLNGIFRFFLYRHGRESASPPA